jgi:hypothetical protein
VRGRVLGPQDSKRGADSAADNAKFDPTPGYTTAMAAFPSGADSAPPAGESPRPQSIEHDLVEAVPTARPAESAVAVRAQLVGVRYDDASHVFVVDEDRRLVGVAEIGDAVAASAARPVGELARANDFPVSRGSPSCSSSLGTRASSTREDHRTSGKSGASLGCDTSWRAAFAAPAIASASAPSSSMP